MNLPAISALQAAILDSIGAREVPGHELRERLKKLGINKSGPAFYQAMARLEEAEFVTGRYEFEVVEDQSLRRRVYKITGNGLKALQAAVSFHQSLAFAQGGFGHA